MQVDSPAYPSYPCCQVNNKNSISVSLSWHAATCRDHTIDFPFLRNKDTDKKICAAARTIPLSVSSCVHLLASVPAWLYNFPFHTNGLPSRARWHPFSKCCRLVLYFHFLNSLPTSTISLFFLCQSFVAPSFCFCLSIRQSPTSPFPLTARAHCLFKNGLWLLVKATAWVVIDATRRECAGSLGCNLCGKYPLNVTCSWLSCWTCYLSYLTKQLATFFICARKCWACSPERLERYRLRLSGDRLSCQICTCCGLVAQKRVLWAFLQYLLLFALLNSLVLWASLRADVIAMTPSKGVYVERLWSSTANLK